jgi:hypothetical protein
VRSMFLGRITFNPAGPVRRLHDGRIQFPYGGTVEYDGVERRVEPADEIALELDTTIEKARVIINGVPLDEIGLDS